jgi:hypothetical protein
MAFFGKNPPYSGKFCDSQWNGESLPARHVSSCSEANTIGNVSSPGTGAAGELRADLAVVLIDTNMRPRRKLTAALGVRQLGKRTARNPGGESLGGKARGYPDR